MSSKAALSQRRTAIGAERQMRRAAPYNARVWQAVMAKALAARAGILRAYLDKRATR